MKKYIPLFLVSLFVVINNYGMEGKKNEAKEAGVEKCISAIFASFDYENLQNSTTAMAEQIVRVGERFPEGEQKKNFGDLAQAISIYGTTEPGIKREEAKNKIAFLIKKSSHLKAEDTL